MELHRKHGARSALSDEAIISLYWDRDRKAITETDFKYGKYLYTIIYNILHDKLDCEECLNDTYLGAWNAMPPARPQVLRAFLVTISRRIAIKRYHKLRQKGAVPSEMTVALAEVEDFIAENSSAEEAFDAKQLGQIISRFVRSLPQRQRYIFISRYYAAEPIDTIAKELVLSRSMIHKELAAIRTALKETLESEGYSV
jgi:RNA polymerase sigma-70 factor (ECF subfamily)